MGQLKTDTEQIREQIRVLNNRAGTVIHRRADGSEEEKGTAVQTPAVTQLSTRPFTD